MSEVVYDEGLHVKELSEQLKQAQDEYAELNKKYVAMRSENVTLNLEISKLKFALNHLYNYMIKEAK